MLMLRITAAVIAALGIPMAVLGAQLWDAGGTPYYVIAGLGMTAAAADLWRVNGRGFYVFAGVLLLTLAWAVYEAGISIWLVGSRIWIVGLLAIWLCMPFIRRALWKDAARPLFQIRTVQVCAAASALVLLAMVYDLTTIPAEDIEATTYGAVQNPGDWSAYGGSHKGTRYAAHRQINADNVDQLERAWEADTKTYGRFAGTPIQVGDGLYLCTAGNMLISLDPDTGDERWRFDPENEQPRIGLLGNCRGVTYHRIPGTTQGERCAERIYTATTDARMISVDMHTGQPCPEFGSDGQISLLAGMGEVKKYYYMVTSPPALVRDTLVVGGLVMDNQETEAPSGVVRGYDARTGALRWAWDVGREGKTVMPPEGGYYTRGTPNVWSLMSADDDLGLVYVPTGNATPDYFGGHRTPVMDEYASSVVAIDAETGLTRWHFQTAHHDIWDYDVASQPTLVDLALASQQGKKRKALIQPTKRGELFVLDRETGELLTEVTERQVPQTKLPHERTSATQPFSTGMPSFAHTELGGKDMFGVTPFDQIDCRKRLHELDFDGSMTPPSVGGALLYPGPAGGMNWGSVAVDEERQLMVVTALQLPWVIHMIPREEDTVAAPEDGGFSAGYGVGGPQRGTPFAARVELFTSSFGLPCMKPPLGEIAVVDLTHQRTVWRRGMGTLKLGVPYAAGAIVTGGGLIFIAGIVDGYARAIDVETGRVLWKDQLSVPSEATPMTYVSPKTGRQYVLVSEPSTTLSYLDAGDIDLESIPAGAMDKTGKVIAYALPSR